MSKPILTSLFIISFFICILNIQANSHKELLNNLIVKQKTKQKKDLKEKNKSEYKVNSKEQANKYAEELNQEAATSSPYFGSKIQGDISRWDYGLTPGSDFSKEAILENRRMNRNAFIRKCLIIGLVVASLLGITIWGIIAFKKANNKSS